MKRFVNVIIVIVFVSLTASSMTVSGFLNYFEHLDGVTHVSDAKTSQSLARDLNMKIRGENTYALSDTDAAVMSEIRKNLSEISDEKYSPIINQEDGNGKCLARIYMDNDHKKSVKRMLIVVFNGNNVVVSFVKGIINDMDSSKKR